jgi:hypothetical protein
MWRVRICVCKDFASQIFLCMGLRFLAEKFSDLLFHVRAELGIPEKSSRMFVSECHRFRSISLSLFCSSNGR